MPGSRLKRACSSTRNGAGSISKPPSPLMYCSDPRCSWLIAMTNHTTAKLPLLTDTVSGSLHYFMLHRLSLKWVRKVSGMCNSGAWQRPVRNGHWIPVTNSGDSIILLDEVDALSYQHAESGGESGQDYTLYRYMWGCVVA